MLSFLLIYRIMHINEPLARECTHTLHMQMHNKKIPPAKIELLSQVVARPFFPPSVMSICGQIDLMETYQSATYADLCSALLSIDEAARRDLMAAQTSSRAGELLHIIANSFESQSRRSRETTETQIRNEILTKSKENMKTEKRIKGAQQ